MNIKLENVVRFAVILTLSSMALGAHAADKDGAKLFEEKRCYICHEMKTVSLGPPLIAVAARHAPRKDIMGEVLARKIVQGGGGNWGVVPMVPNQWVSMDEARVLADWILTMKVE